MGIKRNPDFRWHSHVGLIAIITVYLFIATIYSVATPIFEASDEIWHYPYVKLIAEGKGLPVQKPRAEDNVARQEGSQPPLYYALAALATFWVDTGDFDSLAWVNPHAKVGDPLAHGNKNMAIHTSRESFPYQGPALAVHIIRWLSILMGAVTVACVYATARRVLPSRREVALGAAALVAFNPEFAFISASINNDNLITMLASLIVLMLLVDLQSGLTIRRSLLLGMALGLALLSKLTAIGLIPVVLATVAILAYRRRSVSYFLSHSFVVLLVSVLAAGWWYVRNWLLYGDPTGLSMMLKIVGIRVPQPSLLDLLAEFEGFRISFWGLFGAVNVIGASWFYKLLDGMVVMALFGLSVAGARFLLKQASYNKRWADSTDGAPEGPRHFSVRKLTTECLSTLLRKDSIAVPHGILMLVPAVWTAVVFVLFVRWTQTTLGSQGRLVFPALTGISVLLSLGLASLAPRRLSWLPLGIAGSFLLVFSTLTPFRYLWPSYAAPPVLTVRDVPTTVQLANIDYGGKMRLIGYDLDRRPLKPGDQAKLVLYWQALAPMDSDYSIFIHFVGRGNRAVAQEDTYPGLGAYPTRLWKVGDIIAEEHRLSVFSTAESPALVRLVVGMYTLANMNRLQAYNRDGTPFGDSPVLAQLKLASAAPPPIPANSLTTANFSEVVDLIGYDLSESTVKAGDNLKLTLYWRARRQIDEDYTVFTQVLSPQQLIYGQHDRRPASGDYPTQLWDEGEVVADEHIIPTKANSPPGRYTLITGMYLPATNQRLRLAAPGSSDYFVVGEILVAASK